MTSILHTGDTHIGTRQYGLEERRRDFSRAFDQIVRIALDQGVDAVIHAGDLFNDRYPSTDDLRDVLRPLQDLHAAGIPFLGVVGNHEGKRGRQWIDLFTELKLAVHLAPDEPYDLKGTPIWGLDYAGRRLGDVQPPPAPGGVLVMHQMLDRVQPQGELRMADLQGCGARLVLLGDYHEHKIWQEKGVLVSYCGSTERWSAGERGRRGCTLFDLETGRFERVELRTRRFLYLDGARDPLNELDAYAHQLRGAVVVIRLEREMEMEMEMEMDIWSPRKLESEGQKRGALAVIVRNRLTSEAVSGEALPEVTVEFGDLDRMVADQLDKLELSDLARAVDRVIRDEAVADSNVDTAVETLLEGEGL